MIFVVLLQASIAIDDKIGLIYNQEVLTKRFFTACFPLQRFLYMQHPEHGCAIKMIRL